MLDIQLTQGVVQAIPVVIVPFANQPTLARSDQSFSAVIEHDLANTGQFRVVPSTTAAASISSAPSPETMAAWQQQHIHAVVEGTVQAIAGGRYQIYYRVLDLSVQENSGSSAEPTVLAAASLTVDRAGLRHAAHTVSDAVYFQLTGVKGIFNTKIAYILVEPRSAQQTLYSLKLADQDGLNEQTLLRSYHPIMSPAWSPDGTQIAYVSFERNRASIYLQDIATGQRQLISRLPGVNGAPAFSPDGRQLALVLTKTGNPKIYTLDLASHALTQVTQGYSIDTEPAWSPDGQSILFTSSRGGNPQLYQVSVTGGAVERVTFSGNYNARGRFFPDGTAIVMMHRGSGLFGIAKQNLSDAETQVLVQSGADESPSLSPNGKMVLYATVIGGRGMLSVVSTDGRVRLRLPAKEGSVQEPAWSPYLS